MSADVVHAALRLMLVTDGRGDPDRLRRIVDEAVAGGVTCVQVREPAMGAGVLSDLVADLVSRCTPHGVPVLVNDRADVAAVAGAGGVHLPRRGLTAQSCRSLAPAGSPWIVGAAAHSAAELSDARAAGASYATLSPVWATTCKPGQAALGPQRAAALSWEASPLPVVWLGGVEPCNLAGLGEPERRSYVGVAVRSAICDASSPGDVAAAIRALLPN